MLQELVLILLRLSKLSVGHRARFKEVCVEEEVLSNWIAPQFVNVCVNLCRLPPGFPVQDIGSGSDVSSSDFQNLQ